MTCQRCGEPDHCACVHAACCTCGSKGHGICQDHPVVDVTIEHHPDSWCALCTMQILAHADKPSISAVVREAGRYGVQVMALALAGCRRCESEACGEFDGIHCYSDGCAMARREG